MLLIKIIKKYNMSDYDDDFEANDGFGSPPPKNNVGYQPNYGSNKNNSKLDNVTASLFDNI